MKKIIFKTVLLLCFVLIYSCGYKVIDSTINSNFTIKEIKNTGNSRINYKIKNNLFINSLENSNNHLSINLTTTKNKNIKEKNIKNEVTKYEITIKTNVKFKLIKNDKNASFTILVSGDYMVGDNYSATLNNEKNLIENLTESLSKKILNQLTQKINDI